jgi:anti-sigma B factor antagonist
MDDLAVTVAPADDTGLAVVRCEGEIDLSTCNALHTALESVIAAKPQALRLDLTGTRFLDSTGVACLLRANDACLEAGVPFTVVLAADSPIVRLFMLAGIASRIETILAETTDSSSVERPLSRPISSARTEFLVAVREALDDQLSAEQTQIESGA